MSRLFDALRKAMADGHATDILPVFGGRPEQVITPTAPAAPPRAASSAGVATGEQQTPEAAVYRSATLHIQAGVPVIPFDGSEPRAAEQYRIIRTRIVHDHRQPRILALSSPTPGDGKTVTTINIAASLALKSAVSVLLIDCDLRRSGIAATLGIAPEPGLAEVLGGTCPLRSAIVRIEELPGLHVLPAGATRANPTELLDSAAWKALCASAREDFHYVVLDSSPVGAVADYDLVQAAADGVIMVVRPDHTNRALSFKSLESIPKEKLLGVIVNCAKDWVLHRTSTYYQYSEYR